MTAVPAFLLLLAALLSPATAGAQGPTNLTGLAVVSMKGTLAADEKTANETGWGGISFGFTGAAAGTIRWFGVVHASLFGGNTFDAKSAVFRAHMVPSLIVAGPPELAKQLRELPDGTRVQIDGAIDRRSSNILLDLVKPLPPAP